MRQRAVAKRWPADRSAQDGPCTRAMSRAVRAGERDAETRAEELVRRADEDVDAERLHVDRPVRREVHRVAPCERACLVRERRDRGTRWRADGVRRERERDDFRALRELPLEVVHVERRVVVERRDTTLDMDDLERQLLRADESGRVPARSELRRHAPPVRRASPRSRTRQARSHGRTRCTTGRAGGSTWRRSASTSFARRRVLQPAPRASVRLLRGASSEAPVCGPPGAERAARPSLRGASRSRTNCWPASSRPSSTWSRSGGTRPGAQARTARARGGRPLGRLRGPRLSESGRTCRDVRVHAQPRHASTKWRGHSATAASPRGTAGLLRRRGDARARP